MSLPTPPAPPQAPPQATQPPAYVNPAPSPAPPTSYFPPTNTPAPSISNSSSDLTNRQENSNTAVNNTRISNVSVVNQDLKGSRTTVGGISYERASAYINGSINSYGDSVVTVGVVFPLGGAKIARAANSIAEADAIASRGRLCVSIRDQGLDLEQAAAIAGPRADWVKLCVRKTVSVVQVKETVTTAELELVQLRLEVAEMRAKYQVHKQQREAPNHPPIRGLW